MKIALCCELVFRYDQYYPLDGRLVDGVCKAEQAKGNGCTGDEPDGPDGCPVDLVEVVEETRERESTITGESESLSRRRQDERGSHVEFWRSVNLSTRVVLVSHTSHAAIHQRCSRRCESELT